VTNFSLIEIIKRDQLQARKNREQLKAVALTTLIGEAEAIGKKNNAAPTDEEVIALVKKFIKNLDETLDAISSGQNVLAKELLLNEKALYESYLPKQMDESTLRTAIMVIIMSADSPPPLGIVMKQLKERFGSTFDGATASRLIKEELAK
jgi:uncharacterized protein YqeY